MKESIKVINPSDNSTLWRANNKIHFILHKWRICEFALKELPKVLKILDVPNWCLGGSVAGMLYGCDFDRVPHDIDVVVPVGTLSKKFIKLLEDNPLIRIPDQGTSSTDSEHNTNHICFQLINGYIIDLIENPIGEKLEAIRWNCEVPVSTPKSLAEAKTCYHRPKDKEDLSKLGELLRKLQ